MDFERHLTEILIPFYLGEQPDLKGRMIQDIWTWDFENLERVHNYIQWLFPLPERSTFNSDAPVLDGEAIEAFQEDPRLQRNLLRSLVLMLKFYGLKAYKNKSGEILINRSEDYEIRKREWVYPYDHNYLRITRILKCLMTLGCRNEAQAFYQCLQQIYQENRDEIGVETFQYWTNAIQESEPCVP